MHTSIIHSQLMAHDLKRQYASWKNPPVKPFTVVVGDLYRWSIGPKQNQACDWFCCSALLPVYHQHLQQRPILVLTS
jgi:hypothetical protein